MDEQRKVAQFVAEHELEAKPTFRILDLVAEVGEIAADATKSTNWGAEPNELDVKTDEVGDALFSLLLVADSLDIDVSDALDEALEKYERRIAETGMLPQKTKSLTARPTRHASVDSRLPFPSVL